MKEITNFLDIKKIKYEVISDDIIAIFRDDMIKAYPMANKYHEEINGAYALCLEDMRKEIKSSYIYWSGKDDDVLFLRKNTI